MIKFTEDCLIGIERIDLKRKEFFDILMFEEKDKEETHYKIRASRLIGKLVVYADEVIKEEIAYLEETEDAELSLQKAEHEWFSDEVIKFSEDIATTEDMKAFYDGIIRFMIRWFYKHMVSKDTLIGRDNLIKRAEAKKNEEDLAMLKEQLETKSEAVDNENPFAFTEKYFTGIPFVDEEHRKLFEIIEAANDVIHNDFLYDKYDQITNILEELLEYTKYHFTDEEIYMESIGYEGLELQKKAHAMFIQKIEDVNLDDVDENQDEYLMKILDFLLNWLANHILKLDMNIPKQEEN